MSYSLTNLLGKCPYQTYQAAWIDEYKAVRARNEISLQRFYEARITAKVDSNQELEEKARRTGITAAEALKLQAAYGWLARHKADYECAVKDLGDVFVARHSE